MTVDEKYAVAMAVSGDLLNRINSHATKEPAIALIVDIIDQRHNAPFIATIYEATQEISSGINQRSDDLPSRS